MKRLCYVVSLVLSITIMISACGFSESESLVERNYIGNLNSLGLLGFNETNMFFMESNGEGSYLYKTNLKMQHKQVVTQSFCRYLNLCHNKIYFVDKDDIVCSMNLDGSDLKKLFEPKVDYLYVYKDKIYTRVAHNNTDEVWRTRRYNLISMDLDGGNMNILCSEAVFKIYGYNDHLYYLYYSDEGQRKGFLKKVGLDGENAETIFETTENISCFSIYNNYIYYITDPGAIAKRDLDGNNRVIIKKQGINLSGNFINISDHYVIYQGLDMFHYIYDLNTNKDICMTTYQPESALPFENGMVMETGVYTANDQIYYYQDGKLNKL